jgi:hypothetical protein
MHSGLEVGELGANGTQHHLGAELLFQRFEPGNEHAVADLRRHRLFAARSHVEISPPFGESAVSDRDRRQPKSRDIVLHWHRRDKDVVGEETIDVGERQQLFAQMPAASHRKAAHTSNRVVRQPALDFTFGNCRMPGWQRIEIPNCRPNLLHRRIDHRASIGPDNGRVPDLVVSAGDLQEILHERIGKLAVIDMTGNAIEPPVACPTKRLLDGLGRAPAQAPSL